MTIPQILEDGEETHLSDIPPPRIGAKRELLQEDRRDAEHDAEQDGDVDVQQEKDHVRESQEI